MISALAMNLLGLWSVPGALGETFAAPLAASIPPPPGMVNWWPGDGNANDIQGTANGTLQGGATFASAKVLQGFSLNGTGAFVTFGSSAGNFGTSDFSVDFWALTSSASPQAVLGKRADCNPLGGSFWTTRTTPDGRLQVEIDDLAGNYAQVVTPQVVDDGQFHLVAVVRQATTLSVYVDGNPAGSAGAAGIANITNAADLAAGKNPCVGVDGTAFFAGLLDEIESFNRALTVAEIQAIYTAGSDGKTKPQPTVTLSPADDVNTVGTNHTVTATVNYTAGNPATALKVLFSVQGATTTTGSCITDSTGTCSFSYQGPQLPGADVIKGCADTDNNGSVGVNEPCGTATKAWVLPTTTPGQVTGGGQIPNAAGNDQNAFGFNAQSTSNGVKGECTVVDPSTEIKIKCVDATTLIQSGTHATFFGNAIVNGVATTYRIDVDDFGEPGKNKDTFKIQTASGYTAGGILIRGNVQIHP